MSNKNINEYEDDKLKLEKLVGAKYSFPDGDNIQVVEIKLRDRGIENKGKEGIAPFVTYRIQQGPGIPRQLSMFYQEFIDTYGHLFTEELGRQ
jgi:hypothetical protein|tara:strand:+ start:43 stop:321 length:279 start_codon:yes stop_codon:yes gene_type:complete